MHTRNMKWKITAPSIKPLPRGRFLVHFFPWKIEFSGKIPRNFPRKIDHDFTKLFPRKISWKFGHFSMEKFPGKIGVECEIFHGKIGYLCHEGNIWNHCFLRTIFLTAKLEKNDWTLKADFLYQYLQNLIVRHTKIYHFALFGWN
jgi:hypothetical protein